MALPDVSVPGTNTIIAPTGRTSGDGKVIRNEVLLSVPEHEFHLLRPALEFVDLPRYAVLFEQGASIDHAYFLNSGMISLVMIANDGRSVEVGLCGRDGIVGAPLVFGYDRAPSRGIVQLPGNGVRINVAEFWEALQKCPVFRRALGRFVFTQQLQVAQTAACNRLHDMEQRLARWLLMCQDTADSGALPLTHEFMAQMLGTGRPTVTIAAGLLERAGLIENGRGSVRILNRKRLEDAACECYGAMLSFRGNAALQ